MRDSTADLHVSCLTNSFLSVHLLCIMDEAQAEQQALLLFCLMLQLHHRRSPWSCDCADWLRHRAAGELLITPPASTLCYIMHMCICRFKRDTNAHFLKTVVYFDFFLNYLIYWLKGYVSSAIYDYRLIAVRFFQTQLSTSWTHVCLAFVCLAAD